MVHMERVPPPPTCAGSTVDEEESAAVRRLRLVHWQLVVEAPGSSGSRPRARRTGQSTGRPERLAFSHSCAPASVPCSEASTRHHGQERQQQQHRVHAPVKLSSRLHGKLPDSPACSTPAKAGTNKARGVRTLVGRYEAREWLGNYYGCFRYE